MTRNTPINDFPPKLPIGAFQPILDEARNLAPSMVEDIRVINGPTGGYGFRRGWWTVERRNGERARVFCSVAHELELKDQYEKVKESAATAFAIRDLHGDQ